jgi:hypothetical protein
MAHLRVLARLPSLLKACLILSFAAANHQHSNISLKQQQQQQKYHVTSNVTTTASPPSNFACIS